MDRRFLEKKKIGKKKKDKKKTEKKRKKGKVRRNKQRLMWTFAKYKQRNKETEKDTYRISSNLVRHEK